MDHSLTRYGLDPVDDEDLRSYFAGPTPVGVIDVARWSAVERIVREQYSTLGELETQLAAYYSSGLLTFALKSKVAEREYDEGHPYTPQPVGGAALHDWANREKVREPLLRWLQGLYAREASGSTNGNDRLILDAIRLDCTETLERLVAHFNSRKAYLRRVDERERRERENEARVEREKLAATGQQLTSSVGPKKKVNRRKWGELPPEPQVTYRRPR